MDFAFLGLIALSALPLVTVGIIIILVIKQYRREKALGNDLNLRGTVVTGRIVKHRVEDAKKRGYRCYLTYQYVFEGTEYEYEQLVNMEGFNAVRDGEMIDILFLPQNPSMPRLAPVDRYSFAFNQ
jgi:Protein of unknown function (DUF3592)